MKSEPSLYVQRMTALLDALAEAQTEEEKQLVKDQMREAGETLLTPRQREYQERNWYERETE